MYRVKAGSNGEHRGKQIDAQLSAAIDQNWTRQVDWLKTLVGFPSLRGEEGAMPGLDRARIRDARLGGRPLHPR